MSGHVSFWSGVFSLLSVALFGSQEDMVAVCCLVGNFGGILIGMATEGFINV